MTFGTAAGEQGQSTHDSVQITLHLKYQIKPIQLGTHQIGKLCSPLLQSHSSKEYCNTFLSGAICDAQLALGLSLKCHKSFPLSNFIPSTPIAGSKKPPPKILVPKHSGRNGRTLFTGSFSLFLCVLLCLKVKELFLYVATYRVRVSSCMYVFKLLLLFLFLFCLKSLIRPLFTVKESVNLWSCSMKNSRKRAASVQRLH